MGINVHPHGHLCTKLWAYWIQFLSSLSHLPYYQVLMFSVMSLPTCPFLYILAANVWLRVLTFYFHM